MNVAEDRSPPELTDYKNYSQGDCETEQSEQQTLGPFFQVTDHLGLPVREASFIEVQ
jgi:hypothetical protein